MATRESIGESLEGSIVVTNEDIYFSMDMPIIMNHRGTNIAHNRETSY